MISNKCDLLLFFAPGSSPTNPPLGLGRLTSFLLNKDISVQQHDLGLEFILYLLDPEIIRTFVKKLAIKHGDSDDLLSAIEALNDLPAYATNILKIMENRKDPTGKAEKQLNVIFDVISLFSDTYSSSVIDLRNNAFLFKKYNPYSTADILKAIKDRSDNPFLDFYRARIFRLIRESKPSLIGISVLSAQQFIPALILSYYIKHLFKHIHVTIGGSFISYIADKLAGNKKLLGLADSFIVSEGELPLYTLFKSVLNKDPFDHIPNLIYLKNNKPFFNGISDPLPLKYLPCPNFDGIEPRKYFSSKFMIPLSIVRGCYWDKCAFCNRIHFHGKYQTKPIEIVLSDIIELIEKYKTNIFALMDDGIDPAYLKRFSSMVIKSNIKATFYAATRFDKNLDPSTLQLMYQAGFRLLNFGLESGCQRVLNIMHKGIKLSHAIKILTCCKKIGIKTTVSFFIGFPGETREEALATIDFIKKHKQIITYPDFSGPFFLTSKSPVYARPQYFGVTNIVKKNRGLDLSDLQSYKVSSGISCEEAERMSRETFKSGFFNTSFVGTTRGG